MNILARVRKVGNSLSIVIPGDEARAQKISEGDIVELAIKKKVKPEQLFGSVKFSKSSQEMKDEDRRGWGK